MSTTKLWCFAWLATLISVHELTAKGPPVEESAMLADSIVVGKVIEIEKETIGARPHANAPKSEIVAYRLATVKVVEDLVGPGGRTQVRIGFPDGADGAPAAGTEGVFFLDPHFSGDFHLIRMVPLPNRLFLPRTAPDFDAGVASIRRVVAVYADPVAALKNKDKDARLFAAKALLYRYYRPRWAADGNRWPREDVPAEENKLLLVALTEMPWVPADGDRSKPCLAQNIYMQVEPEKWGFKVPSAERVAADPRPYPRDRLIEEDLAKFVTENADKIRLKRYVRPKDR